MCAKSTQITLTIDDSQFKALLKVTPGELNREFNRGFGLTMGAFMRRFDKQAFGKGKIKIRRSGAFKKRKGGIFIPKRSRKFGFTGRVHGRKRLEGKVAEVKNRSPHADAHEYGATIRPKRGRYLIIPVAGSNRNSVARARRAGVDIPRGQKPRFIKVRRVKIKARLGFHKTFRRFRPEAIRRFNVSVKRAIAASQRRAKRAKAKGK